MISKWIVLLFATFVMSELSGEIRNDHHHLIARSADHARQTRSFLKPQPLGFFGKVAYLGGLLFQQYNDTSSAFKQLRDIIQDQFSDTATKGPPQTTSEPGETTTERYRLSRKEVGQIVSRNLRGLQKLARIELADARNQSLYTIAEYKQQLHNQLRPKDGYLHKKLNLTIPNKL